MPDQVLLVHGLGGRRLDLWPIARRLRQRGYRVQSFGYSSFGTHIESIVPRLAQVVEELERRSAGVRWHVVTHSLGGILVRAMLAQRSCDRLGRIVMLAPPHGGSHVARRLAPFLAWLAPTLRQLSDSVDSFVSQLPNPFLTARCELGIVAATRDRVILPAAVQIAGAKEIAWVAGHHGVLPWYRSTIEFVDRFLRTGRFTAE